MLADYQLDEINNIEKRLGIVTDEDIENELIQQLNKNKEETKSQFKISAGKNGYL